MNQGAYDVSVVSAKALPAGALPPEWTFAFTTGYGMWALAMGSNGKNPNLVTVPWDVVLKIRYDSGDEVFRYRQIGDTIHLQPALHKAPFNHKSNVSLLVWTKTQPLLIRNKSGLYTRMEFPWEKPCSYLCAFYALLQSGFYDDNQMSVLFNPFDPPEWAGKGCIIDDQSYFDAVLACPTTFRVYHGYWQFFMNRFCAFMKHCGLLSICHPKVTEKTQFSVEGAVSSKDQAHILERMPSFFSSELQVGLNRRIPRKAVAEFHNTLPPGLQKWIERHRGQRVSKKSNVRTID